MPKTKPKHGLGASQAGERAPEPQPRAEHNRPPTRFLGPCKSTLSARGDYTKVF